MTRLKFQLCLVVMLLCASFVQAQLITAQSATPGSTTSVIAWTTPAAANSQVKYGLTSAYGSQTTLDAAAVTSHSETITGLTVATLYHYQVVSIDSVGNTVTSPDGTFTTTSAPSVTLQPVSTTVCAGNLASFTSTATGSPAPTVQWQRSTVAGGSTYANITGATSTTYTFSTVAGDNNFNFRAIFTGTGSVTSSVAALTVNVTPVVTTQPMSKTVNATATATFTVAASGTPSPGVQWSQSTDNGATFQPISGATSTTLSLTNTTVSQNGYQFMATFSNSCGSANSSPATLNVVSGKTYNISFSAGSNRASGAFIQGASLSGNKYIWTSSNSDATNFNPTGISQVAFYLDGSPNTTVSTLFPTTRVPALADSADGNELEVGVKFTSTVSGLLTAIRFYKATANTGIHIGSVWSSSGTKLGSVTFTGESASGWQEQALVTPITIVANTTYIVSYHLPIGHYSYTTQFYSAAYSAPPLAAPIGAGVYTYGGSGNPVFPINSSGNFANYEVDFKFSANTANPLSVDTVVPYDFNNSYQVPAFVQVKAAPATIIPTNTTVPVVLNVNETSGNTNVVAIGWGDITHTVSSVTDSHSNTYTQIGTTITNGTGLRQAFYYSKNITGGGNTVTVTFNGPAAFPDAIVAEYSGLDTTAPLDVFNSALGSGTAAASTPVQIASANELLVGIGATTNAFTAAGGGFTNRVIDIYGNLLEDRNVNALGSYSATATNGSSSAWIMQMAGFRAAIGVMAWNTASVSNGLHTITELVTKTDGSTELDSSTFMVSNTAHTAALTWVKGAAANPITFNVYRGTVSGGPYTRIASGVNALAYTDTTVSSGVTYYYVVSEVDQVTIIESGFSNQVAAVIP